MHQTHATHPPPWLGRHISPTDLTTHVPKSSTNNPRIHNVQQYSSLVQQQYSSTKTVVSSTHQQPTHTAIFFLFRPRVFSRALGSGARREPARTPRRKCEPWPRSVARALEAQSRENWQVTTGRHSDHVYPSRPMQTHVQVNKMSDGMRMSFRILLTARTDCLPTSCLCSSARTPARVRLVLMPECSCSCFLCRTIQTSQVFIFRLFAFCSVCCCKKK